MAVAVVCCCRGALRSGRGSRPQLTNGLLRAGLPRARESLGEEQRFGAGTEAMQFTSWCSWTRCRLPHVAVTVAPKPAGGRR